jgi:histone H3/H4
MEDSISELEDLERISDDLQTAFSKKDGKRVSFSPREEIIEYECERERRGRESLRAGLLFPTEKIARYLHQERFGQRIGAAATIFLTAVLQFIAGEILKLAVRECIDQKIVKISPKQITNGVSLHAELAPLLQKHVPPTAEEERSGLFLTSIYNVLKSLYEHEFTISKRAIALLNSMLMEIMFQIATETSILARAKHENNFSARYVEASIHSLFIGDLQVHAIIHGNDAMKHCLDM